MMTVLRSIFYRRTGDAEWIRAVGPAGGFRITDLPAEVKYEVDIGDGEIREVTTKLPSAGSPWTPLMFPLHFSQAYFSEDLADGPVAEWQPRGLRGLRPDRGFGEDNKLARQLTPSLQPTKTAEGVVFAPGSGQRLEIPYEQMSVGLHRWALAVFKMNTSVGSNGTIFVINGNYRQPAVYVESGKVRSHWTSRVRDFDAATGNPLRAPAGAVRDLPLISDCANGVFDGKAWNISLTFRRMGKTFSRLNGVAHSAHTAPNMRFNTERRQDNGGSIGPMNQGSQWPNPTTHHGMVLKYLILGQGEISEKWERKLEGWAAWDVGQQAMLPADHPYRAAAPTVEHDDYEQFFAPDVATWNGWRTGEAWNQNVTNAKGQTVQRKYEFRGQPAPSLAGYTRVFMDDFRRNSVGDSQYYRTDELDNWYAPGWNTAVGGDAGNSNPEMVGYHRDDPYRYQMIEWDGTRKYLKLNQRHYPNSDPYLANGTVPPSTADRLVTEVQDAATEGKARSTAIYMIDDSGRGRSFKDGYVARIRFKYDDIDDPVGKARPLFWAFWGYAQRTREWWHENRQENDFIEPDATNPAYMNGSSNHLHESAVPSITPRQPSAKVVGSTMTKANGWPFDMKWWSGKWITLEAKVDPDLTVISIDVGPNPGTNGMTNSSANVNDRSNMIELFRHATAPHMLNPFYFIANTCARNSERQKAGMYAHFTRATQKLDGDGNRLWIQANGSEGTTKTATPAREWANYRYWIDWIEILQRDSVVYPATPPAPFTQRPTLSQSGSVITCNPRITGLSHVEYRWHVDGYPVGGKWGPTYTRAAGDVGKQIKCLVIAAGYQGKPEAWTDGLTAA